MYVDDVIGLEGLTRVIGRCKKTAPHVFIKIFISFFGEEAGKPGERARGVVCEREKETETECESEREKQRESEREGCCSRRMPPPSTTK